MDDNTNPVVSPFSGTNDDAVSPPVNQPSPSEPPWHAPSLPTEPEPTPLMPSIPPIPTPSEPLSPPTVEPALPPAEPVVPAKPAAPPADSSLPVVEPSFPPPPPEKPTEPETVVLPKKKSSAGKAIVLTLIFFILAVGGVFGYLTVQQGGLPFSLLKKAEGCPAPGSECGDDGHLCAGECACNWSECRGVRKHYECANHRVEEYTDWDDNCNSSCTAPTCGGTQPPAPSGCNPTITYSGATTPGMDCKEGNNASVTITACLPADASCASKEITFSKTEASCPGKNWAGCGGACGTPSTQGTFSVNRGACASRTVSCNPPGACGSCQVDIDNYGVRRWQDSGCTAPTLTPPATPPVMVTPISLPTCTSLTVTKVTATGESTDLSDLKVGDQIKITLEATANTAVNVEDLAIRIIKNGVKLEDKVAGEARRTWTQTYTLPAAGNYEIHGLVKAMTFKTIF